MSMTDKNMDAKHEDARWVSVPEAASILGVAAQTLYRLARLDRVPHIRVGRIVRVNLHTLEEFLSRRAEEV